MTADRAVTTESLAEEIRALYAADPSRAEVLIEKYLREKSDGYAPEETHLQLDALATLFASTGSEKPPAVKGLEAGIEQREFSKLFSVLLGRSVSGEELSSPEVLEKLAASINTVFDTLNRIIRVIHTTLLGEREELETIRQIIGSSIEVGGRTDSLQNYLDEIQKAFLISHDAFKYAAQAKVKQMLDELDPKGIASKTEGGLKFGPLRKAELFDVYTQRYEDLEKWFSSGRFTNELMREFEKTCRKLNKIKLNEKKGAS